MSKSKKIVFPCIMVSQPIGEFFLGSVRAKDLLDITRADIRRIERDEKREIERYLGIQRPLSTTRVKELQEYVKAPDACFPTAVILSISSKYAKFDSKANTMTLSAEAVGENEFEKIASILDGQHRLKGLEGFGGTFDVNVSIFIDADLEQQAIIFSTVNLAQTKVNKSLTYDLYELAKSRSPQKTCHDVAVAVSSLEDGPFYKRIKRLGFAVEGEEASLQTITQATFVESLLPLLTKNANKDRVLLLRKQTLEPVGEKELRGMPFRNMFIEENDLDIAEVVSNYFEAIRDRWPKAWAALARGSMLARTNGFKAFMRVLPKIYVQTSVPGEVPQVKEFMSWLKKVQLSDDDFTTANYPPGQGGESALYEKVLADLGLSRK